MSLCAISCKSDTCKYIIYGYFRQLENQYKFARIISQSTMELCFMFYHQYLLELQIPNNVSLFTLLFATYHLKDALLFDKWNLLNSSIQYEIATCFKLDQQEFEIECLKLTISQQQSVKNNKLPQSMLKKNTYPRFIKSLKENISIHYNTDIYSDIYRWSTVIFSNLFAENKILSSINII
eukprot:484178_1